MSGFINQRDCFAGMKLTPANQNCRLHLRTLLMKHWFSERLNISSCYKESTCRIIARFGGMIEVLAAKVTYGIHKKELIKLYKSNIYDGYFLS